MHHQVVDIEIVNFAVCIIIRTVQLHTGGIRLHTGSATGTEIQQQKQIRCVQTAVTVHIATLPVDRPELPAVFPGVDLRSGIRKAIDAGA